MEKRRDGGRSLFLFLWERRNGEVLLVMRCSSASPDGRTWMREETAGRISKRKSGCTYIGLFLSQPGSPGPNPKLHTYPHCVVRNVKEAQAQGVSGPLYFRNRLNSLYEGRLGSRPIEVSSISAGKRQPFNGDSIREEYRGGLDRALR